LRIVIATIGTRGDVQPYVALAQGLIAAHHRVTLCTHRTFQPFVEAHNVEFAPLAGDIRSLLASDVGRRLLVERNPLAAVRKLHSLAAPLLRQVMADIIDAADGADLILASTLAYPNAITASQVHRVALVLAGLQPFTPTVDFPCALLPPLRRRFPGRGLYHRFTHHAAFRLLQLTSARLANRFRRELVGLPALRYADVFGDLIAQRTPVIYGFSEHLLPRPADYAPTIKITGFWFLDQEQTWRPSEELQDFITKGEAPIYIGFGSMADRNPEQLMQIAIAALMRSGRRGILATGWEGMRGRSPSNSILMIDGAPHDWLFPRVAMVVHHGGVGTVAAALRAGVPQIVTPFSVDQPLWAEMVFRRGVGPKPLSRQQLNVARLTEAITTTLADSQVRATARCLAGAVQAEDGVGRAVDAVNRILFAGHQFDRPRVGA
jgi:UDP:flavonoid glycosyltransferase YjiC (YdhE family)